MYSKTLYTKQNITLVLLLSFILILLIWISLISGNSGISIEDTLKIFDDNSRFSIIFFEIRIPRTLAAIVVGAALGLSGAIMQAVLKNPLASPFTLGISQASAFGASFAIIVLQVYSISSFYSAGFITALLLFLLV